MGVRACYLLGDGALEPLAQTRYVRGPRRSHPDPAHLRQQMDQWIDANLENGAAND